jgi:NADP-dependent 3-hydroxy acid dehydrogenase YdfG
VEKFSDATAMVRALADELSQLDVVVHCAGVIRRGAKHDSCAEDRRRAAPADPSGGDLAGR